MSYRMKMWAFGWKPRSKGCRCSCAPSSFIALLWHRPGPDGPISVKVRKVRSAVTICTPLRPEQQQISFQRHAGLRDLTESNAKGRRHARIHNAAMLLVVGPATGGEPQRQRWHCSAALKESIDHTSFSSCCHSRVFDARAIVGKKGGQALQAAQVPETTTRQRWVAVDAQVCKVCQSIQVHQAVIGELSIDEFETLQSLQARQGYRIYLHTHATTRIRKSLGNAT